MTKEIKFYIDGNNSSHPIIQNNIHKLTNISKTELKNRKGYKKHRNDIKRTH